MQNFSERSLYHVFSLPISQQPRNVECVSSINLLALYYSYTIIIQHIILDQKHHIVPQNESFDSGEPLRTPYYSPNTPWEEHSFNPYRLPTERREWMRPAPTLNMGHCLTFAPTSLDCLVHGRKGLNVPSIMGSVDGTQ
jgi:hypothetical protein